jgi:protoheme IX farnesyltransferase
MSASVIVAPSRAASIPVRVVAYLELTKPKIAVMVLVAVAAAANIASWGHADALVVASTLVGTLLVAGSSCAANQYLERRRDALMRRTLDRPLPQGRLTSFEAVAFSFTTLLLGLAWLAATTTLLTSVVALATWVLYVAVYTPLKTRTSLNTLVGAIPGALPVLIGWTAVEGPVGLRMAGLFFILFIWQFPHFMAIAWLYRQQYGDAGFRMLTTTEPTGRLAGLQAVLGTLALVPVSLLPVVSLPGAGALAYGSAAVALGLGQLATAVLFARNPTDVSARRLLKASLLYLPTLLACLVFLPGR